jgi:acyl-CoA oxidase
MPPSPHARTQVHFNLFAGTVVALGTPAQVAALEARNRERPRLGCFGLTECLAGVNSGMVVETEAHLVSGEFVINTPKASSAKNWISQVHAAVNLYLFCFFRARVWSFF